MNQCEFEGCTHEKIWPTMPLCSGHRKQLMDGKKLTPLRQWKRRPDAPTGYAFCNRCLSFKLDEEFHHLANGKARHMCKDCCVEVNRIARHRKKGMLV